MHMCMHMYMCMLDISTPLDFAEEDGDAEHGESPPEDGKLPLHMCPETRKARQVCSRLNRVSTMRV